MNGTRHLLSWDNGKGEDSIDPDANMTEQLEKVRNIVKALGWMDEGSFEQGQEIVAGLSVEVELLVRAVFNKYPEIKERADNGEI